MPLLEVRPFRGAVFPPFVESGETRIGPTEKDRAREAHDQTVLRALHGACVQVFGNVRDDQEADERLDLLSVAHENLSPGSADEAVARLSSRLISKVGSDVLQPGDLGVRYLAALENPKTSPTFSERQSREWIARAVRRWVRRPESDRNALVLLVARLVRTSLPMGSVVPEMPVFLGGFTGFPLAGFSEIGRRLVHSCRPTCRWTCLDGKLAIWSSDGTSDVATPWTGNLVPHLDAFRRGPTGLWKKILCKAHSTEPGVDEVSEDVVRGAGHAKMLRLLHGLECRCDGSSLRRETKLAAEEAWYEAERRCGCCCKWTRSPVGMLRCSKCKFQRYCDTTCQRRHWPFHRQVCSAMSDPDGFRERLYRCALLLSQSTD